MLTRRLKHFEIWNFNAKARVLRIVPEEGLYPAIDVIRQIHPGIIIQYTTVTHTISKVYTKCRPLTYG